MIVLELTREQRSAIDAPFDGCVAIVGPAAAGKSTALTQRAVRARELSPKAQPLAVAAPGELDEYAVALLVSLGVRATLIDDVEAERIFADCAAPLLALQWDEFAANQLDPEIPSLRSPERFLRSAFRLVRRLRDAAIAPGAFLSGALTGATEFYANPPNLADPALLLGTKSNYHDSLDVAPPELQRQYRRELDLAKTLAKLYERYVEAVESSGRMTGRDAAIAAARRLREDAPAAAALRARHGYAFLDDAQDLTAAQCALLSAIFGERLAGVTLCGDAGAAIAPLRMTQPDATFARAQTRIELRDVRRMPRVEGRRAATPREEAGEIAEQVAAWIAQGSPPERIAVLFRSVRHVALYENALLDLDVPAVTWGDVNIFADRRALDALALLWNVHDPFRHDWLLRTLGNPAFGLSDASLATLCGEPADPQRALFAFDEEFAPTVRASRWDPKRDLRLGWNVVRGEKDDALAPDAADRVRRFRRLREGWLATMESVPFEDFARTVWREGLAREGAPGSARARAQQFALARLLRRLGDFAREGASVAGVLDYAERRRHSDLESFYPVRDVAGAPGAVRLLSIDAAQGCEFDRVVVAGASAGSFPRWYSPDAFLFSPRLGMIPKENVGDARASRTAKFTFYIARSKAAKHYYERERRAFAYALSRARESVLVTASGQPTRGVSAPEFLQEVR